MMGGWSGQMIHSRTALLAVVGLAVLGLWAVDRIVAVYWVGSFPLEVRLLPRFDRQVVKVWAGTLPSLECAEQVQQDIRCAESSLRPSDDFDGSRFVINVHCSGRDSALGFQKHYFQCRLLVVKFEFADNETAHQVVEIPEGRGPRRVSVQVP
jgi:hypothetical protein